MAAEYTALKADDDLNEERDLEYLEQGEDTKKDVPSQRWILVSLLLAVLCTLLNFVIPPPSHPAPGVLYQPNIYVGLENLDATVQKASLPDRLTVFPHVFAPVSSAEPARVFPTDGNARLTFNGLVSPGEPHVVINAHTSMIMQHRVHDYGLNRCAMVSTMPDPALLAAQNRTLSLSPNHFALDVWRLDAPAHLDPKTLSWNTRPARVERVASLEVRTGEETSSAEFDCGRSGDVRMYEFACAEGVAGCALEFIQRQPETTPRMAITIEQRPSIM